MILVALLFLYLILYDYEGEGVFLKTKPTRQVGFDTLPTFVFVSNQPGTNYQRGMEWAANLRFNGGE